MNASIPFYLSYHVVLYLVVVLSVLRLKGAPVVFVAAAVLMGITCELSLPGADLEWYRWRFEETDWDSFLLVALEQDFEFAWFLGAILVKNIFGDLASPGLFLFLIVCFPLLFRSARENIWVFALFLFFPGTFLVMNNVIRQGFSEYILLLGLVTGRVGIQLSSLAFHRFGGFVSMLYVAERYLRSRARMVAAVCTLFVGVVCYKFFMPEGMTDIYSTLVFSPLSFAVKMATVLLPFAYVKLFYSWEEILDMAQGRFAILMIASAFGFLILSGRMADRTVFFVLPVTLSAMRVDRGGGWAKIAFASVVLILGMSSMMLASHQIYFFDGVGAGGAH
ncbi:MAG: hypothetical protein IPK50_00050 [Fibrobacterota bacterium]|nr:MAG: hypothetical protein IPK50_00050 [Fibrobacterota bacterium]